VGSLPKANGNKKPAIIVLMAWTAPEIDNVIETHEHKGEFKEPKAMPQLAPAGHSAASRHWL
jgi:hypothetical protein